MCNYARSENDPEGSASPDLSVTPSTGRRPPSPAPAPGQEEATQWPKGPLGSLKSLQFHPPPIAPHRAGAKQEPSLSTRRDAIQRGKEHLGGGGEPSLGGLRESSAPRLRLRSIRLDGPSPDGHSPQNGGEWLEARFFRCWEQRRW